MASSQVVDISAGDSTPELAQTSLIDAVKVINKFGFNIEIPPAASTGPIVMRRNVTIASPGMSIIPAQAESYGAKLSLTHGQLKLSMLQQSVDLNDERLYLINNASPTPGTTYTGGFVYDKNGAAASYYLQRSGEHTFATAPIAGSAGTTATFTDRLKIDSTGIRVTGQVVGVNNVANNVTLANFLNTSNGSNLNIASVNSANSYVQGSVPGDSAIRAETNNLVIGAQAGNTVIGTSTKTQARFNTSGKVVLPGLNSTQTEYGSLTVGGGVTAIVGTGSDTADVNKSFWIYKNGLVNDFNGGGIQYNSTNGLDVHVGNTTSWLRTATFHSTGRTLFGGAAGATPIGDVHINIQGIDQSGSLSLTGMSNASYILLGNRDSLGTPGPAIIASSNRQIQFGVGTSFFNRAGGTFTQYAVISGGSFGVGLSSPETYGPFAVNVTNGAAVGQVVMALNSPSTVASGGAGGGFGIYWGNNVFVGNRVISAGDANNAGLGFYVANGGSSVQAGYFDTSNNLVVKGSSILLGSANVTPMSSNSSGDTFLRGGVIWMQNAATTVNYLSASASAINLLQNTTVSANLQVNGTIVASRQIETTTDKALSSGVIAFDYNTNSTWVCASQTSNFTANFTNVGTTIGQIQTCTLILQQGATGYGPNAVQINGTAVTVKWAGGMAPVWTPNNVDVCVFSLVRTTSNSWIVLASVTPYV